MIYSYSDFKNSSRDINRDIIESLKGEANVTASHKETTATAIK